jgi:hypothetical protein
MPTGLATASTAVNGYTLRACCFYLRRYTTTRYPGAPVAGPSLEPVQGIIIKKEKGKKEKPVIIISNSGCFLLFPLIPFSV